MPEPRQILVLGSSLTALAVVRNAVANGLRVILVDSARGVAFSSRCVSERWQIDPSEQDSLLPRFERLTSQAPTALMADSDNWLHWIRRHREGLAAAGLTVLHPSNEILATCLDKQRFSAWCADHRLPSPACCEPGDDGEPLQPLEYPLFIRPRTTRHTELASIPKAAVVQNATELRAVLEPFRQWNVPALISSSLLAPGLRQFSYGFARRADGALCSLLAEKLRPHPDQYATGSLVVTANAPQVQALAQQAVETLGYVGIGEVELLHNDRTGETHLIEINARPWLQYALAIRSGRDLLRFHVRPQAYDAGRESDAPLRWISLGGDLFHCFSRKAGLRQQGRLTWREYFASLRGKRVWAAWSWRDPRPACQMTMQAVMGFYSRPLASGPGRSDTRRAAVSSTRVPAS